MAPITLTTLGARAQVATAFSQLVLFGTVLPESKYSGPLSMLLVKAYPRPRELETQCMIDGCRRLVGSADSLCSPWRSSPRADPSRFLRKVWVELFPGSGGKRRDEHCLKGSDIVVLVCHYIARDTWEGTGIVTSQSVTSQWSTTIAVQRYRTKQRPRILGHVATEDRGLVMLHTAILSRVWVRLSIFA